MKGFLYRAICGFFLAISVLAPGISGSVMAIVMGIYDRLLEIVANPLKNLKRNLRFLLPMGVGAMICLVLFVLLFGYLFENYEKLTYLLFVGLIVGNIPVISKPIRKGGFKLHYLLGILVTFCIALAAGILSPAAAGSQADIALVNNLLYLGLCGFLGGVACLIPGMSVSMILMVLGVYNRFISAARSLDLAVIAVVGVCFAVALVLSSRLIRYVFHRYPGFAHSLVLGFMCGSVAGILVGLPKDGASFTWWLGALMVVAGMGVSLLFVLLGRKLKEQRE